MTVTILTGDCRDVLRTLPGESVHCIVTSPPYWGLRDYGVTGQIGLETTPEEYTDELVGIFGELRRVLRVDGTVWLNLGDSYNGYMANQRATSISAANQSARPIFESGRGRRTGTLKAKDLVGIPWRVAFALQADGWWLRQDIIWSKPNPMPESVTDRCTKAHEYIFLLSKSERYWYDSEAIAEVSIRSGDIPGGSKKHTGVNDMQIRQGLEIHSKNAVAETRNKRSVWEIATAPFAEAHFATFPPALIEPCILAGCPKECCAKCGAPWVRQTEYGRVVSTGGSNNGQRAANLSALGPRGDAKLSDSYIAGKFEQREKLTVGWSSSCSCNIGTVPGTCLDPFGGAGTTGLVADRLGRNSILIELNPEYAVMAERRIKQDAGMFAEVSAP